MTNLLRLDIVATLRCNHLMKSPQKLTYSRSVPRFRAELIRQAFGQLTTREQGTALTKFYISEIHNGRQRRLMTLTWKKV